MLNNFRTDFFDFISDEIRCHRLMFECTGRVFLPEFSSKYATGRSMENVSVKLVKFREI